MPRISVHSTVFQQVFIESLSVRGPGQQRVLTADGTNEKILMKGLLNDMWAELQGKTLDPQGSRVETRDSFYQSRAANPEEEGAWPESWFVDQILLLLKMKF